MVTVKNKENTGQFVKENKHQSCHLLKTTTVKMLVSQEEMSSFIFSALNTDWNMVITQLVLLVMLIPLLVGLKKAVPVQKSNKAHLHFLLEFHIDFIVHIIHKYLCVINTLYNVEICGMKWGTTMGHVTACWHPQFIPVIQRGSPLKAQKRRRHFLSDSWLPQQRALSRRVSALPFQAHLVCRLKVGRKVSHSGSWMGAPARSREVSCGSKKSQDMRGYGVPRTQHNLRCEKMYTEIKVTGINRPHMTVTRKSVHGYVESTRKSFLFVSRSTMVFS